MEAMPSEKGAPGVPRAVATQGNRRHVTETKTLRRGLVQLCAVWMRISWVSSLIGMTIVTHYGWLVVACFAKWFSGRIRCLPLLTKHIFVYENDR